jgi:hypothetical protein
MGGVASAIHASHSWSLFAVRGVMGCGSIAASLHCYCLAGALMCA